MRIAPPKPEREPSQRKRRQKELNEDFIDISSQRAFASIFFQPKKKSAKKQQPSPKKDQTSDKKKQQKVEATTKAKAKNSGL